MTSQGSPHARFQRFIRESQVFHAELAAREIGTLTLENALSLVHAYAQTSDPKYERAALKWLRRLLDERDLTLGEARRAVEWLEQLRGEDADRATTSLAGLLRTPARTTPNETGERPL